VREKGCVGEEGVRELAMKRRTIYDKQSRTKDEKTEGNIEEERAKAVGGGGGKKTMDTVEEGEIGKDDGESLEEESGG
jgi:hypothetical protein